MCLPAPRCPQNALPRLSSGPPRPRCSLLLSCCPKYSNMALCVVIYESLAYCSTQTSSTSEEMSFAKSPIPVTILCLCQETGCPPDSFVWYLLEVEQCTVWYVVWYSVASVGLVTSFITKPSRFCALFCTPTLCRTWCYTHTRHSTLYNN